MSDRKSLLYFVSEDWYFVSHRLPVARKARELGYDVHVVTRVGGARKSIEREGFTVHAIDIDRSSVNVLNDFGTISAVRDVFRVVNPLVVHNVAMKPILYGSLVARLHETPYVINAFPGLGYMFSSPALRARVLRQLTSWGLSWANKRTAAKVIVQNEDDRETLISSGVVEDDRVELIRGSGVDVTRFDYVDRSSHTSNPVVAFPARLLREKGIYTFVEAARLLRNKGVQARMVLIGSPDEMNPSSVTMPEVRHWVEEGLVEDWGWSADMSETLKKVDVVCLPSTYGEGLPKSLLEAASSGIPIVTTDSPGCRDTVADGETGYIVPRDSPERVSSAIARLVSDSDLRTRMGTAGRSRMIGLFSEHRVVSETARLYSIPLQ